MLGTLRALNLPEAVAERILTRIILRAETERKVTLRFGRKSDAPSRLRWRPGPSGTVIVERRSPTCLEWLVHRRGREIALSIPQLVRLFIQSLC